MNCSACNMLFSSETWYFFTHCELSVKEFECYWMEYFQRRTESSWAETLSIAIIQRLHSVRNHFGMNAFQREILCIGSLNVSLRVSFEELALTRPQTLGQIFLSGQKKNWLYLLCVRHPVLHHSKSAQESAEDELK